MDENTFNNPWLALILMMYGMEQNPNLLNDLQKSLGEYNNPHVSIWWYQLDDKEEDRKRKEQEETIRYHCDAIEYEQDMGQSIPFCKRYGGFCNMQCVQNGNYYKCRDENKGE